MRTEVGVERNVRASGLRTEEGCNKGGRSTSHTGTTDLNGNMEVLWGKRD